MGMIQNDELVKVFSERTIGNLEYIERVYEEKKKRGEIPDVFDATQLINSLLGLIVFPKERVFSSIPRTPLGDLKGWPYIQQTDDCRDLKSFFRLLRNSVAHCNIHLLGEDVIEGIRFMNKSNGRVTWYCEFSLEDVRIIAINLYHLLHGEQEG